MSMHPTVEPQGRPRTTSLGMLEVVEQRNAVELRVLGPLDVLVDGRSVELGGRKQRTVLAVLIANCGQMVSTDRCLHAVWGDAAPTSALRSLQTYISNLRRILDPTRGGLIEGATEGYRLTTSDADVVDWVEFHRLADSDDLEDLTAALDLWRGRPFEDVEAEWLRPQVVAWEQRRLTTVEAWADARLARGETDDLIEDLSRLVEEYPLHEPIWARLMTALYRANRQVDALAAYQRLRSALGEELGIEPSPELRALEERILLQDPRLAARATATNVPAPMINTIGRDADMAALRGLLDQTRLLTITGVGGVGKTTAAQDLARLQVDAFPDGVWWFELAALRDPELIVPAMLGAMRIPSRAGVAPLETICTALAEQTSLLVFDNCEHMIVDVAGIVVDVLRAASGVKVVATSRVPLGVPGEVAWSLPPLATPGVEVTEVAGVLGSDAARLFEIRARDADTSFEVSDANASSVGSICRRLDGLPFAIELAAARVRSMGPKELEARLDDRFQLLTGGSRTEVPHHQTLAGTVEWSYELLQPEEQKLYRMMSVFRGGFGLDAVESVEQSDRALDLIDALVAHSLVIADRVEDTTRYRMLETIREHGRALLAESDELDAARAAQLAYVAGLVSEGARKLEGRESATWMMRFRSEIDNIRAALSFAAETDPVTGAAMCAGLSRFWWGYATEKDVTTLDDATSFLEEGRRWSDRMLEAAGSALPDKIRARLLLAVGGLLDIRLGLYEDATARLQEAEELWQATGNIRNQGWSVFYQGIASWGVVSTDETVRLFDRSNALHEEAEDPFGAGMSKLLRGYTAIAAGDFEAGKPDFEAFEELAQTTGNPFMLGHAEDGKALWAIGAGKATTEERRRIADAINYFRELGNYACMGHSIQTAAMLLAQQGRLEEAARCLGIVMASRDRLGMVVSPYEDRTGWVERLGVDSLGDETRKQAEDGGRGMEPTVAIEWVLAALEPSRSETPAPRQSAQHGGDNPIR